MQSVPSAMRTKDGLNQSVRLLATAILDHIGIIRDK